MSRQIAERRDVIPALGELFRERGYADTSLSEITQRTGLGKGSLYHFFPGGKQEMAHAVLDEIHAWFDSEVFRPLSDSADPQRGITRMFDAVGAFFASGRRICLVGAFALDGTRDQFASEVQGYFAAWNKALVTAFRHAGVEAPLARDVAEEVIVGIQGALVLARALDDPRVFGRALKRLRRRTQEMTAQS